MKTMTEALEALVIKVIRGIESGNKETVEDFYSDINRAISQIERYLELKTLVEDYTNKVIESELENTQLPHSQEVNYNVNDLLYKIIKIV